MTVKKKITSLSDMEYDEISLVGVAANQEADIVLFKSGKKVCECSNPRGVGICEKCGGVKIRKSDSVVAVDNSGLLARSRFVMAKTKK